MSSVMSSAVRKVSAKGCLEEQTREEPFDAPAKTKLRKDPKKQSIASLSGKRQHEARSQKRQDREDENL